MLVGMDFDPREQRLRIRRLNARRLQLGWRDLVVEQRRSDEAFQIVVGLLFNRPLANLSRAAR